MTKPPSGEAGAPDGLTPPHDLASLYALDCLGPEEAATFERHLRDCAACRVEVDQTREMTARLATGSELAPPASLRTGLLARIAQTPQLPVATGPARTRQSSARKGLSSGHKGSSSPREGTVRPLPQRRLARRARTGTAGVKPGRGWGRAPYLVAAVAVLVALAAGGWGLRAHQQAQQADQQRQQLARLLAASDVATASGPVSGGGQATIVWSTSRDRAVFVAAGLVAPPDGRVYQLWTIPAGGTPVPAGTFTPHRPDIVVPLPVAALSAHTVALTVEPAGGSAQPTTTPVIALTVQ